MRKPSRTELAPWVHFLLFGAVVTVVLAWQSIPRLAWLVSHPEILGASLAALARALGWGVSKLPHFQHGRSVRDLYAARDRLHARIERAIDTLAFVQAKLDTEVEDVQANGNGG